MVAAITTDVDECPMRDIHRLVIDAAANVDDANAAPGDALDGALDRRARGSRSRTGRSVVTALRHPIGAALLAALLAASNQTEQQDDGREPHRLPLPQTPPTNESCCSAGAK